MRRENLQSEFKIIAVVKTDQLNCSRMSANEQSNVLFCNPITASASTARSHSLYSYPLPITHDALMQFNSTAENFNL